MTEESLRSLKVLYGSYVDTYRGADGSLPEMMELKLKHTGLVVANAIAIATEEGFDGNTRLVCEAAALLHDTGRYEQLKRFNTFRDVDSVDHAVFSHEIVKERGWLEKCGVCEGEAQAILKAVLVHNRREIPGGMDDLTLTASKVVRDADKLDIFRVLEERVTTCDWRTGSREFWNLTPGLPPSKAVIEAILAKRPVDYGAIASLPDFILIQVGWMICGLNYASSRRLAARRGHLEFRRRFLKEITSDPAIDVICDLAKNVMEGA